MNITDADREAAKQFITIGKAWTVEQLVQTFAVHRLRGYNAGLETAAKRLEGAPNFAKAIRAMIEGDDR